MSSLLDEIAFPKRVREALDQQKLWRAKEILRGHVGNLEYSPELYEQYGVVLLEMQDLLQAGKYLFLCGRRRPEYELPIDIYLTRHGKTGKALVDSFPAAVRTRALHRLGDVVHNELAARGFTDFRENPRSRSHRAPSLFMQRLVLAGCAVLGLFFIVAAIVGMFVIGRHVTAFFH